jgi:hypothetical protein
MALPIAATPVLKGKEAKKFYEEIAENAKKGVPSEEVKRADEIFKGVMRNSPQMRRIFGVPDDI